MYPRWKNLTERDERRLRKLTRILLYPDTLIYGATRTLSDVAFKSYPALLVAQHRAPFFTLRTETRAMGGFGDIVWYESNLTPERGWLQSYIDRWGAAATVVDLEKRGPTITNILMCRKRRHFVAKCSKMIEKSPYTSNQTRFYAGGGAILITSIRSVTSEIKAIVRMGIPHIHQTANTVKGEIRIYQASP